MKKEKKLYRCNHCKRESTLITLGDMYQGCAYCGYCEGFSKSTDGGKTWSNEERTSQTDALNRFMNCGHF